MKYVLDDGTLRAYMSKNASFQHSSTCFKHPSTRCDQPAVFRATQLLQNGFFKATHNFSTKTTLCCSAQKYLVLCCWHASIIRQKYTH